MLQASQDIIDNIDIFIPVPIHKKRLMERKYNQSQLLAEEMANKTGKKCIPDFLCKTKHTMPQARLERDQRLKNLSNKFAINQKYLNMLKQYRSMSFAIIDDVVTTGSTVSECTKTLNKAGIRNVYVIGFAKTVLQ